MKRDNSRYKVRLEEIQLLEKRRTDRLSGKSKIYTLEEAREIIKGKPKPIAT